MQESTCGSPHASYYLLLGIGMRATSDEFHIQSSECMVLLKQDRPPSWLTRGHRRRILWTAQNSDPESSIDTDLSIYVAASSKARLAGLESQTQPVLVLIEGLPLAGHHTLRAACFKLSGTDNAGTLQVQYLCPVTTLTRPENGHT
jgi:hypothetical protein